MDFGRPLVVAEGIVSRSNVRFLPNEEVHDGEASTTANGATRDELDDMVLATSNQAATQLILGPLSDQEKKDPDLSKRVNAALYKEHALPLQSTIQPGDLVVIMESFNKLTFAYAEQGAIYNNRNGHFHHDDFIGKPFGCKIRSRNNMGYGFCYLLKPTPELWARSLNHRTQIVHELDQSQVIFQLQLRPNMTVIESGTGSGAMSHAMMRTIAPHGRLHTYEFNQQRADTARQEFAKNGVEQLVQVHHKDVCGKGDGAGGFDLPGQSVDAAFLDLPEPWLAIPHAAFVLKPNARIATYSPCVEQTQRTVEALGQHGFHSIQTMEYRLREHYVDRVSYEAPPRKKRERPEPHNLDVYLNGGASEVDQKAPSEAMSTATDLDGSAVADDGEGDGKRQANAVQGEQSNNTAVPSTFEKNGNGTDGDETAAALSTRKRKTMTVARPFSTMRGHTAFLTFATASTQPQPDPNTRQKNDS